LNMLELKNISKKIQGSSILSDIHLSIRKGEFITLLGPSGCGKTTTLRIIAGFEKPDSGEILLDGKNITKLAPHKRSTNTVFQNYALFPHMTVEENVSFGLRMKGISKKERSARACEALKLVKLYDMQKRRPDSLSGGQKQRVAIARAIINKPEILLLDEPLAALDYKLRQQMQLELKELQRKLGITFIFVTHDQEEALTMSDRIAVMQNGRIEQIDTPSGIYDHPKTRFVGDFIGEVNILVARRNGEAYLEDERMNFTMQEDSMYFAVRPERIWVRRTDFILGADDIALKGHVVEQLYMGSLTRTLVKVQSNKIISAIEFTGDTIRFEPGEEVLIYWAKKDMTAVSA